MKPQRLLLVSEPALYGVFFFTRQLARFLRQHHPEVIVDLAYSSRRGASNRANLAGFVDEIRAAGGEAIDLHVGNGPEPRDLPALWRLWRLIRRRSPQLIHAQSSKAGGLCRLLARLPGCPPVLYTPHAYYGLAGTGGKKEKIFNGLESFLGRVGHTHAVSSDERRFARESLGLPGRAVVLVNNGIDSAHFTFASPPDRAAAREQLGLPVAGKLLVSMGRVGPQKNYPPLYAALNRLLADQPSLMFAHLGAGSKKCRETLDAAVRSRCFAFDYLDDLRMFYWAADGFILTSLYEGMSTAVLEAASAGLPLLLTDAPGLSVMRAYGLEIDWMPNPRTRRDFAADVFQALTIWSRRPPGALASQREIVCRNFDMQTQMGKVVRLQQWLAGSRKL
jgi:glycosyltransferase involved in cell wall biosynthesis